MTGGQTVMKKGVFSVGHFHQAWDPPPPKTCWGSSGCTPGKGELGRAHRLGCSWEPQEGRACDQHDGEGGAVLAEALYCPMWRLRLSKARP